MKKFIFSLKNRNKFTHQEYLNLVDSLLEEDKTTGPNQSESMIHYTKMNQSRMNRVYKKFVPSENAMAFFSKIKEPLTWVIITEAWCGDAAHNVPVIAKLAELHPFIDLTIILRDENLDIMDTFLTRGGRSIPKLIVKDQEDNIKFTWGPRPKAAQEVYNVYLNNKDTMTYDDISKDLQLWYSRNKGHDVSTEIVNLTKAYLSQTV